MNAMKTIAFAMAVVIVVFGGLCILAPPAPIWVAQHVASPFMFCVVGAIRIAFGLILISVARASRFPKTIRVFGYFILIDGIATVVMGFVAIDQARAIIGWWLQLGTLYVRIIGVVALIFGGFIAYACVPFRRAS